MASSRKSPKNSTLLARVTAAIERHVRRGGHLVAGLSGGIDSVVLFDLLCRASRRGAFRLSAVHVNHQINPAAGAWATFCRRLCRARGVPLTVRTVQVRRGNSLEAAARDARYAVFAGLNAGAVVLAHNQDDQVETLLLQLLRGSGVKGASAMPEFRPDKPALLRPLLEVPRSEIAAYARSRKLVWIEDDSNDDVAFDRNYVRHRVMPLIAARFPAYRRTLARASRHFAEAALLADACAALDAGDCTKTLDVRRLRDLPLPRLKNVLRHFLAQHHLPMPNARRLEECARQVLHGGTRMRLQLGAFELRREGDRLQVAVTAARTVAAFTAHGWHGEKKIALPELNGVFHMTPCRGGGLSLERLAGAEVILRLRQGGERLRPVPGRPSRTLKNLWQEARVPESQRGRLPLLFVDGVLAYAPGIGADAGFLAGRGERAVMPDWRPRPA